MGILDRYFWLWFIYSTSDCVLIPSLRISFDYPGQRFGGNFSPVLSLGVKFTPKENYVERFRLPCVFITSLAFYLKNVQYFVIVPMEKFRCYIATLIPPPKTSVVSTLQKMRSHLSRHHRILTSFDFLCLSHILKTGNITFYENNAWQKKYTSITLSFWYVGLSMLHTVTGSNQCHDHSVEHVDYPKKSINYVKKKKYCNGEFVLSNSALKMAI